MRVTDREEFHVALPSAEINAVLERHFEDDVLQCPRCGCGLSRRMEDGIATYCGCCGQLVCLGNVAS